MHLKPFIMMLSMAALPTLPIPQAQAEGDQFLDGIGETALAARYPLEGNLEDRSRNGLHAVIENGAPAFVDDAQFGRVLVLPEAATGSCLRVPAEALEGMEDFSLTGWFNLSPSNQDRCFFFLGGRGVEVGCVFSSDGEESPMLGMFIIDNGQTRDKAAAFKGRSGEWIHLAMVHDAAAGRQRLYVDGVLLLEFPIGETVLANRLTPGGAPSPKLLIGGSPSAGDPGFGGRLHDIRLYRTALSDRQVETIHHNAISEEKRGSEGTSGSGADADQDGPDAAFSADLIGLEPVSVTTGIGVLPHLPYYVKGIYRDGRDGPMVRVIWPAPRDNAPVRDGEPYTVEGTAPGTGLKAIASISFRSPASPVPVPRPVPALAPFPLGQVILNPAPDGEPTPFMAHRDKFLKGLARTNPDTFLYNFRDAFGQPQPEGAEPLRGWDSPTTRLRGHASGHYLTALAQACAGTAYDPELHALFQEKMDYMVNVLYELSRLSGRPAAADGTANSDPCAVPPGPGKDGYDSDLSAAGIRTDYWNWGEGFISGYPPDQFIMLEQGAGYGSRNNQIWAPYYTLHKILAGLMDCYEAGGNPKALEVAEGMGLWVYRRLEALPQETLTQMWNRYIAGEYGGMNEAMARLHRLTGDPRFLECARLFDNTTVFFGDADHSHGLARNVDTIRGKHANQHIPQITGALAVFLETREVDYYRVAENFWDICLNSYMYSIGGVAGAKQPNNAECFTAEPDTLFRNGFSEGGQNETCATYNLLKLGRQLFMIERDAAYMDYYERALYNHILASVAEDDAGNTYHVPLNPGAVKSFGNARMNSFTCCNGTALESATKLQDTIYLKTIDDSGLYVNLYIPSTLTWMERSIKVTQTTAYPRSDTVRLSIEGDGPFVLNLRIPGWVQGTVELKVNGEAVQREIPAGQYLAIDRRWQNGDTVELTLPMDFHLMPLMDQPDIASIFYGPVLLAAEEEAPRTSWRSIALDPDHPAAAFDGDPSTLHFESDGIRFKPFYETYGRHSVYLDILPVAETNAYPPISAMDPPEQDFFARQLDFRGIPIKASSNVDDRAFFAAYDRLAMMLKYLPDVHERLVGAGAELHIIGRNEVTTDLPEWRHDKGRPLAEYGGLTRDERTRGMGGRLASCGEENLLGLPGDRYRGSDICVHEFAHNVLNFGSPRNVARRFEEQRLKSLEKGRWVDSYAATNGNEFFAELAMWYFGSRGNLSMKGPKPADGPDGLKTYDPEAYELVDAFWSGRGV